MVVKGQVLLYIYDELLNNKKISTKDIVEKFNISIRTFRRYISELNSFLFNNFKNQEVVYDPIKKTFKIVETVNN